MKRQLIFVACVALAGCGQQENTGGNASAEASTEAAGGATAAPAVGAQLRPGEWEMTTEMLEMNMPGMPAGMMPKQANTSIRTCVKQSEADNAFFKKGPPNSNCTYSNFSATGGRVKGTATCENAGQAMTMTMDGEYKPESYQMNMAMKSDQMSMKMRTTGRRIGECAS